MSYYEGKSWFIEHFNLLGSVCHVTIFVNFLCKLILYLLNLNNEYRTIWIVFKYLTTPTSIIENQTMAILVVEDESDENI